MASQVSSAPSSSTTTLDPSPVDSLAALERELASQVIHGRSALPAHFHTPTHRIPVALLHLRSHQTALLDLFVHFATHAASALAVPISKPAPLPIKRTLWTVPKGPFVHKKSQENFERKVYGRVIKAWDADDVVVQRWLDYLSMYSCPGVGMRIVRWMRAPVGVGKVISEEVMANAMKNSETKTDRMKVEEMAKKIIQEEMTAANLTQLGEVNGSTSPKK